MPRPAVFACDTWLYHPTEGKRLFPQGEQDPGAMWSESPGGDPLGGNTAAAAVAELIEANDRIEQLGRQLEAKDKAITDLTAERDAAVAARKAMESEMVELRRMLGAGETLAPVLPVAQDAAQGETGSSEAANSPEVSIPADYATMPFFALKSLATKVAGAPVANKAEALRVIQHHLEAA